MIIKKLLVNVLCLVLVLGVCACDGNVSDSMTSSIQSIYDEQLAQIAIGTLDGAVEYLKMAYTNHLLNDNALSSQPEYSFWAEYGETLEFYKTSRFDTYTDLQSYKKEYIDVLDSFAPCNYYFPKFLQTNDGLYVSYSNEEYCTFNYDKNSLTFVEILEDSFTVEVNYNVGDSASYPHKTQIAFKLSGEKWKICGYTQSKPIFNEPNFDSNSTYTALDLKDADKTPDNQEIKGIVTEIFDGAIEYVYEIANGRSPDYIETDMIFFAAEENGYFGMPLYKSSRFNSIDELVAFASKYIYLPNEYTIENANKYIPKFTEYNGGLYISMTGDTRNVSYDSESIEILSATKNEITVSVSILYGNNSQPEKKTYKIVHTENGWRIALDNIDYF